MSDRQKVRRSSSSGAITFGLNEGSSRRRWPWCSGGSDVMGGVGGRTASGRATETQTDEKCSVSWAIWVTASIVTGMKARP